MRITRYREYRIETQNENDAIIFDVFRGRQHTVAGFDIQDTEENIIYYLKNMINSDFETDALRIIRSIPINREKQ